MAAVALTAPVIIDCDPGIDDAIALLLAFASPELDILAVTTVAGNVGAAQTAHNAAMVREVAGREEVPVHAGCTVPLVRAPVDAGHFHGADGLGPVQPRATSKPVAKEHSVDVLVDTLSGRAGVTLVAMGPLTNVAMALRRAPRIAASIERIVLMGGARTAGGNITPSAEFNIFADPHAAQIVFSSGPPIVAAGLDATHQVRATEARIAAIEALPGERARLAACLLRFSQGIARERMKGEDAPLHDPCTIAWLLRPDLFATRPARVEVETASPLTLGHTAVDFRAPDPRVQWITEADAEGIFALLTERLA